MAVQTIANRQMYPPLGNAYHTSQSLMSTPLHPTHQDAHNRAMYGHGFALPQQLYGYPQYTLAQQSQPSHYTHHAPIQQSYPTMSHAPPMMMPQSQAPIPMLHQSPVYYQQDMRVNSASRVKSEDGSPQMVHKMPMGGNKNGNMSASAASVEPKADPSTAAPGPIPATTPLVVHQDGNGVQWIAFEYSRDRVKLEYTIRCDVESVNTETLSDEFKSANCVYPRACGSKDSYTGNRLQYESECNAVGWALAELNPSLREKRGLIQRAVDSWRNSNRDPRLRSRRVRRMAKINTRKSNHNNNNNSGTNGSANVNGATPTTKSAAVPPQTVAGGQAAGQPSSGRAGVTKGGEAVNGMFRHV